jgi:L-ascorbate metabolism protein UlaG (beta-lactamase superfamily)
MSVITVTRVINATVLVALPGGTVLTDPYFTDHWFMRFSEPVGVSVDQLPKLSAIIGGHQVFDHWQPSSLRHYPYRDTTPVYVANRRMARSARKAGFCQVEVLRWGNQRAVDPDLTITSVPGERITGGRTNS